MDKISFNKITQQEATAESAIGFMNKVYMWMTLGLVVTGLIAWITSSSETLITALITNPFLYWGALIAEVGLVWFLSARVWKMAPATAIVLFMAYAALNGFTLSILSVIYTNQSLAITFFITAGMFGTMSLIGATTKKDLTSIGSYLMMGVIGLVIAGVVNMFSKVN